jgi:hypothetical protein
MDFGKVLTRAWEIIWKHKILWFFGILASCGSQGGNFGGNFNYRTGSGDISNLPPQWQEFFRNLQNGFERTPDERLIGIFIVIVCIILLLALVFWLISVFGRVSLIKGTLLAEAGKSFTFSSLAGESFPVLGSAVLLSFLLGLLPFGLVIALIIVLVPFAMITLGIGLICIIPIVCLLIPLSIAYNVYIEMAYVALVSEGIGVIEAINRGWQVFRNNLANLTVIALILILGGAFVSIILGLPVIFIFAPFLLGMLANTQAAQNSGLIISGICLVLALPVIILATGILHSYLQSAWTLAYQQLSTTKKPAVRAKKK